MAWTTPGNLSAEVHETHTGLVMLLGDRAYKAKKAVVTDFLDFSTPQLRERACAHEIELNSRLAPQSYLGLAYFSGVAGDAPEPVIVMRRYPDTYRLTSLVKDGSPVQAHLVSIAETLASFHARAARGESIDAAATADAVAARWRDNIDELHHQGILAREAIDDVWRLAAQFISGRSALFAKRIAERRIVDGHADLLTDDIFCTPDGPVLLDCLEFDDRLRYVDGIDDVAFLAMDLEYLGRDDLAAFFLAQYRRAAGETAPPTLTDFYVAYRAVVRAKVDCVRVAQGHDEASADAQRHLDIALEHLRACTVRLVMVGGGPGTGKTTLSRALAEQLGAQVISTDDVRRELQAAGVISGAAGEPESGLYSAQNVAAVYDAVLQRARDHLVGGDSVILDATWRDAHQRERVRGLAAETLVPVVELSCSIPVRDAAVRVQNRGPTTSDATAEIAARLAQPDDAWPDAHRIDTGRPLTDSVAEASRIVYESAPVE
ncbi:bifunctional aminoglycoside phosphotransferase/ATP-binding protein [Mycolicibacterium holsaticum]|uniref:Uncharacterized protein n=1 Tax=Mycolicibacterium holsaticum TaxID=152142 RepID=A0A1E3S0L7_9MYCO|nr:AAA family ATPase [Mycolicibacterium holsaticum]ODQ95723.1 hypothetical protein BHQ17_03795 [Mycolicibacterium holsaticum]